MLRKKMATTMTMKVIKIMMMMVTIVIMIIMITNPSHFFPIYLFLSSPPFIFQLICTIGYALENIPVQ